MTIVIRDVALPDDWQLDPRALRQIAKMRRHQIRDAVHVWREAERLTHPSPAMSGASSSLEAS